MRMITDGQHAAEHGDKLVFCRFDPATTGADGTGTFQLWLQDRSQR